MFACSFLVERNDLAVVLVRPCVSAIMCHTHHATFIVSHASCDALHHTIPWYVSVSRPSCVILTMPHSSCHMHHAMHYVMLYLGMSACRPARGSLGPSVERLMAMLRAQYRGLLK